MEEKMSDAELRKRLQSYGLKSIGPITETTRPLYVQKLKKLQNEKKVKGKVSTNGKQASDVPKGLITFSSDESEDEHQQSATIVKNSRSSSTFAKRSRSLRSNVDSSIPTRSLRSRNKENSSANNNADISKTTSYYKRKNDFTDIPTTSTSYRDNRFDLKSHRISPRKQNGKYFTKSEFSDSDQEDEEEEEHSFGEGLEFGDDDLSDQPEMVSHSVNTSARLDSSSFYQSPNQSSNRSGYLRPRSPRNLALSPERYYDQAGVMGTDGFKAQESTTAYKLPHYISSCLIVLTFVFFAVIAAVYVSMHTTSEKSQVFNKMLCTGGNDEPHNCLRRDQYDKAFALVKFISSLVRKQAGNHECGYTTGGRKVSLKKIQEETSQNYGKNHMFMRKSTFDDAINLITNNPAWEIRVYDADGKETNDTQSVVNLESVIGEKTFLCRLSQAVSNLFNMFMYICLAVLVVTVFAAVVRYKWKKQQEEKQQVYELVEKIIDILKEHNENCQEDKDLNNYLAIPHVRDMLIPLKDRRRKQRVWDKAVKFLSANESRVRVETQLIHGEEFAVWKWIQTGGCANGGKVWQGQAFGENKDLKTFPNFTPLPCLKIRNMFNAETEDVADWHVKVQDAIIEKCGPNHGIVHIAVDKSSKEGCVYVKCDSRDTAGKCFSALHGWWFDGKLVTVKFLRQERYHDRFPDSIKCSQYLRPSNDQRSSLAQPYHKSFLEEY